jgi:aminoglycoside/choline kinase family phosphotransferase
MEQHEDLAGALGRVAGWQGRDAVIEPAIPVLASPSWRGVDGLPLVVRDRASGETLFIKQIHPDTAFYIDIPASFDAAVKAGEIGVGPRVLLADAAAGVLIMEDLSAEAGWRVAGLEKGYDPDFVAAVVAARRAYAAVAPLLREVDVFAEIESFYAMALAEKVTLPAETGWMVDMARYAASAMAGHSPARVPVQGDGNVSNILWHADGRVRLLDFDRAGNGDPLEDLASFFNEVFAFEPEAQQAFARLCPEAGATDFDRMRLYAYADDLRWGLIAAIQGTLSERRENEFYKFANWRFVRARMAARDPRFGERTRMVA